MSPHRCDQFGGGLELSDVKLSNPEWRQRIKVVGKENFEIEEMVRLGFLENSSEAEKLVKEIAALAKAREQLIAVDEEIAGLGDVQKHLDSIRKARIERVKAEREFAKRVKALAVSARQRREKLRKIYEPSFFGRGVSSRVDFSNGDDAKVAERELPPLTTFVDLSRWLGVTPTALQWLTYHREALKSEHYSRFEIPKKSGGTRIISSPKPALKDAQNRILREILDKLEFHPASMAFRPEISIADNARLHRGANVVVKMDLKDFFPSIHFDRVRTIFRGVGYNSGVATILALLSTEAPRAKMTLDGNAHYVALGPRSLPQGASTSPSLANLAAKFLDVRLTALAEKTSWTYSRYADDLVFSTSAEDASPHRLIRIVSTIIREQGFEVNPSKTRVMRAPNLQTVTGLQVNEKVKLTNKDAKRIRAFLHQCRTKGVVAMSAELGKDAFNVARGYYAYVHMVDPAAAEKMLRENPWLAKGKK